MPASSANNWTPVVLCIFKMLFRNRVNRPFALTPGSSPNSVRGEKAGRRCLQANIPNPSSSRLSIPR
jgi:hypothetical protein